MKKVVLLSLTVLVVSALFVVKLRFSDTDTTRMNPIEVPKIEQNREITAVENNKDVFKESIPEDVPSKIDDLSPQITSSGENATGDT